MKRLFLAVDSFLNSLVGSTPKTEQSSLRIAAIISWSFAVKAIEALLVGLALTLVSSGVCLALIAMGGIPEFDISLIVRKGLIITSATSVSLLFLAILVFIAVSVQAAFVCGREEAIDRYRSLILRKDRLLDSNVPNDRRRD